MVSAYNELPRTPANFVALSPLRYLSARSLYLPRPSFYYSWQPSDFMETNLSALPSICISASTIRHS